MDFPVQPTLASSAGGTMTELGNQEVKSTTFFTHIVFKSFTSFSESCVIIFYTTLTRWSL